MTAAFKYDVYETCLSLIQERIAILIAELDALKQSLVNETKSTVGDKHETARAMLHMEEKNIRDQLAVFKSQDAVLKQLDPQRKTCTVAAPGSLIETNNGLFYISVPLAKIKVKDHLVFALSAQSPLGNKMIGLSSGDNFSLNDQVYRILTII